MKLKPYDKPLRDQRPLFAGVNYHPFDVIEAARKRIRWLLTKYDDLVVSFSGGKDSLVMMELVDQVYKEQGRTDKVKVKFMDEELVCDSIIAYVKTHAESGRWDFSWYALRMKVGFFVMGRHENFISWDPNRPWHRHPPPYAIFDVGVDTSTHNENSIGQCMHPDTSRKTVELIGIRAQESMKRYYAISRGGRKGSYPNWVSDTDTHLSSCRPIFDMSETDIFKFLHDYEIPYCSNYDAQLWAKAPLRVASALHERAAGQFFKLKALEPTFYEQLRTLYPAVETHYRYWNDVDVFSKMEQFPPTFDGIREYINQYLDEVHRDNALDYVKKYESVRANNLRRDPTIPCGWVPVRQVFMRVIGGKFEKATTSRMGVVPEDLVFEARVHESAEVQ